MALRRFVTAAILFMCPSNIWAFPHAADNDIKALQLTTPSTIPGIILQQNSAPTNSNDVNATPTSTPVSSPTPAIQCFLPTETRPPTDVDGCRKTLNYFRSFPRYRVMQDFLEDRYPKVPSKPPYAVHHTQSNCAVQIAPNVPGVIDRFSFEQARALATEILEECKDKGGRGGFAPIGLNARWKVVVVGFLLPPDPPGGVGLVGEA